MIIESVPLDQLAPDPRNARLHDGFNLEAIRRSLAKFGQQKPIVADRNYVIIAGHGTYQAAQLLGWDSLAVVFSDLEAEDAIAYGIADNATGDTSDWNKDQLKELLGDLKQFEYDLTTLGFTDAEINKLTAPDWTPPEVPNVLPDEHSAKKAKAINLTPAMRETVDRAIEKIREIAADQTMTEGRCIELICADWLS